MKVIKPLRLSLIHRVFDHRKKHIMVMTVAYCFPFSQPRSPVTEVEMWKMAGTDLGRFGVLDHWMFKPQAEVLVTGSCFTGERAKGSEYVRLSVGPADKRAVDKKLFVFGDRRFTLIGPGEPQMFTKMPVDYAHAFGGEKYPHNPIGKGLTTVKDETGAELHPLPNVEDPKALVTSKGDRPTPASFAAWDLTWPVHFEKKMGTYDAKWVEKNGFSLADDVDFSLFNVAAPDQRVDRMWDGSEEIRVENMHPDRRVLETKLPGFKARCLVRYKAEYDKEQKLHDLPLRTDTIHLFPHHERAIVFMRATTEIHTTDATDVELALAALEDDGAPKPLAHYEDVIALRADKKKGGLYALRDGDLMPTSVEISNAYGLRVGDPLEVALERDGLLEQNQHQRSLREYELNRERLLAMDVEPDKIPPPPKPPEKAGPINLEELPAIMARVDQEREAAERHVETQRAESEQLLEALCKEHDIDLEAARAKAKAEGQGPPKFSAQAELDRLEQLAALAASHGADPAELRAQLADPNFRAKLLDAERQFRVKYRLTAHDQDPAPRLTREASEELRAELLAAARGAARTRRDFTGADLEGLDIAGIDLEGAFLEGVSLKGANLRNANLKDAVLARADLEGATLAGANLERANLGRAKLMKADLSGANLTEAILYEADLTGAKLGRANLTRANTMELKCEATDWNGAEAENLFFYKAQLRGATFRGARMKLCTFIECDATDIDATSSDFSQSVFLMSKGDGANFSDSVAENFRIVMSSFERASFKNCQMPGSNLRAAKMTGACLDGANLRRSDLSSTELNGASLERTILVECLMLDVVLEGAKASGANLMLAIMHRANLRGAKVDSANLFCADLSGAVGDKKTSFAGSNVKRALVAGVFHG
ncbi:MAG: DUF2169 domain-containing protein [Polyangiaceae bacterium]|nr:DUF2169 domain-containing protein [Polyangiaceae bacterium]